MSFGKCHLDLLARYVCPALDTVLEFSVFLLPDQAKLVITDIDGTITTSDVRGQVLHLHMHLQLYIHLHL